MVKHLLLIGSISVGVFLNCLLNPEPCIKPDQLDSYTATTLEWLSPMNDSLLTFTDQNGLEETVIRSDYYEHIWDELVEDDCGHTYGSVDRSINYLSSISQNFIEISLRGYSYDDDEGFRININSRKRWDITTSKNSFYDFDQPEKSKNCTILDSVILMDKSYFNIMKSDFNNSSTSDIKTIYYSKELGLVALAFSNGIVSILK